MKKIFTLLCLFMLGTWVFAQDTYVFSDKDGNVYENGVTIECSEAEDDGFGGIQLNSGLYLKNVGAPGDYQVSLQAEITRMDNGIVQLCFPMSCIAYSKTGKQNETGKTTIEAGNAKSIQSEWFPYDYGECTVTYTAKIYQGIFSKGERSITVNYKYADASAINQMMGGAQPKAYYDVQGRATSALRRGLNIVHMSDGSVRKILK